ncbi:MAG: mechanosensitive ion channel family protein [Bacilli bacterium]|nr:mechanosensitive ion channel family protein [Bacilli bacterium]
MEKLELFINNPIVIKIFWSLIAILVNVLLYEIIINIIVNHFEKKLSKAVHKNKIKTYVNLIKSITRYFFIITAILSILQIFNFNITSIIAGVGVLGVVFGLAIQDFLKDIIRGSTILSDNYFQVGDVVKYKDIEGKVLALGLKTTKVKDIRTNNIVSIANRNIEQIEIVSDVIYVRIPMPYEVKLKNAEKAVDDIIKLTKEYETIIDCIYKGITELSDSSIDYYLQVKCNPINKYQAKRDTLRAIIEGLDKNKIEVPFNQIDVHQK